MTIFFYQLNNCSKIWSNQKGLLVPTGFISEVTKVDSTQYATVSTGDVEFMIRGGAACLSMPFLWHYTTVRSCALGLIQWDLEKGIMGTKRPVSSATWGLIAKQTIVAIVRSWYIVVGLPQALQSSGQLEADIPVKLLKRRETKGLKAGLPAAQSDIIRNLYGGEDLRWSSSQPSLLYVSVSSGSQLATAL